MVSKVRYVKYLGIFIDENLKWKNKHFKCPEISTSNLISKKS